jgi:NAD(P)H-hydrate epimerase
MRDSEEAAFARGVTAEALMDAAASGIARTVSKFFPQPGRCIVFAGKGNNAGDALAAAALLAKIDWRIDLRLTSAGDDCGELARKKLANLRPMCRDDVSFVPQPGTPAATIILDGLLGLGATPPLREPIRSACRELNQLRRNGGAFVFALDLPTGLDADSGAADEDCVVADFTITIGFAKRGLLNDQALNFVGRLEVVPLVELRASVTTSEAAMATPESLRPLLPRRPFGAYKNEFGRIGVVAGSKGFTGAAFLCSLGALRAGAGLIELFVPEDIYSVVASAACPEVMVKSVSSYEKLLEEKIDVWAVGPGLGRAHAPEILHLLETAPKPIVVDADALNILSEEMPILERCAGQRLLTPHPGEMKRLFPFEGSRADLAGSFCEKYPATLLLKGSRTIVSERSHPPSYNTTGNPGMATGGMGDVLTGVCAALIAQKLSPYDAARLGAWICGRASEIAIFNRDASEQSLLPTDMADNLGRAFRELQTTEL